MFSDYCRYSKLYEGLVSHYLYAKENDLASVASERHKLESVQDSLVRTNANFCWRIIGTGR
eukprot:754382-Hanusia_phi.AAC.1